MTVTKDNGFFDPEAKSAAVSAITSSSISEQNAPFHELFDEETESKMQQCAAALVKNNELPTQNKSRFKYSFSSPIDKKIVKILIEVSTKGTKLENPKHIEKLMNYSKNNFQMGIFALDENQMYLQERVQQASFVTDKSFSFPQPC